MLKRFQPLLSQVDYVYKYNVILFGMPNVPATFQQMINSVVSGLEQCAAYIDDIVIYNYFCGSVAQSFSRLREANLTVNLSSVMLR